MRKLVLALILTGSSISLRADFTYVQTAALTFSSDNLDNADGTATTIVSGNRMATITEDDIGVIDLDAGTITTIDPGNRTSAEDNDFKISSKATGKTRVIKGLNSRELQIAAETPTMNLVLDTWFAAVPGSEEVRAFQVKVATKLGYGFANVLSPGDAMMLRKELGDSKFLRQVSDELAAMDGLLVQLTLRVYRGEGAKTVTGMSFTLDLANFSAGAADASKFEVPAGFTLE